MIGSSADGGTVTDPVGYVNKIDGALRLGSGAGRGGGVRYRGQATTRMGCGQPMLHQKECLSENDSLCWTGRCGAGIRAAVV